MKRILIAIVVFLLLGTVFISCRTSQKCPAYGESKHFKVEKPNY